MCVFVKQFLRKSGDFTSLGPLSAPFATLRLCGFYVKVAYLKTHNSTKIAPSRH